jgi:NAD(P)-dependent dehydrogenase (short-subunit alcohol dehydrogenase family)
MQHPVGRVGRPKDIADAVVYLASAGFMTGQVMVLDGGMTKKMIYEE